MKATPKSRTGHGNPESNGSREWMKTSPTYFKVTPKSATGRGELASNGTRSEAGVKKGMEAIPKSMPAVPRNAKKWQSRGYQLTGSVLQNFGPKNA